MRGDYHGYYNDYNDYNNCQCIQIIEVQYNYNDYRDRDLDLDWERFSDLVTQLTTIDKLRNLNHDIEE